MTPAYPSTNSTALALPDKFKQKIWEDKFESIPGISRIPENDFVRLRQLLASCEDADSYLTSPIYYSFTGRHGLWVYEKNDAFVFACWHPNVPGQVLVFPQLVKPEVNLVADLLGIMPEPVGGIRIARAKLADTVERADLHQDGRDIAMQRCEETVLDWKYPVHILSTAHTASLSGHKFIKVRNHIRQLSKHSVEIIPFDAINHSRALERLLHRWANYNASNREEYDHLYAPYENLFSQSLDKPLGMSGLMIFVDGEMQAVSLWDVSNTCQKTANVYVNFCNTNIRGLSEFSLVKCCETLRDQGVNFVNLGGSETDSLDNYKRKFTPTMSINLCSVEAKISDVFPFELKRTADPSKRRRSALGAITNA